jgi:hypothetical protein
VNCASRLNLIQLIDHPPPLLLIVSVVVIVVVVVNVNNLHFGSEWSECNYFDEKRGISL